MSCYIVPLTFTRGAALGLTPYTCGEKRSYHVTFSGQFYSHIGEILSPVCPSYIILHITWSRVCNSFYRMFLEFHSMKRKLSCNRYFYKATIVFGRPLSTLKSPSALPYPAGGGLALQIPYPFHFHCFSLF